MQRIVLDSYQDQEPNLLSSSYFTSINILFCLGILPASLSWKFGPTQVLLYSTDLQMAEPVTSLIHIVGVTHLLQLAKIELIMQLTFLLLSKLGDT